MYTADETLQSKILLIVVDVPIWNFRAQINNK